MTPQETRAYHLSLLKRALELETLNEETREAFEDMLSKLTQEMYVAFQETKLIWEQYQLYPKQLAWVLRALGEEEPEPDTRFTSGDIPRGREVATPDVLKNLPKSPPGRR